MIFYSVDSPSSLLSKFINFPNISPLFVIRFDQISKKISKIPYLCGFNPYPPLCYLIQNDFIKLVILVFILMLIHVYSTTSRIHSVTSPLSLIVMQINVANGDETMMVAKGKVDDK